MFYIKDRLSLLWCYVRGTELEHLTLTEAINHLLKHTHCTNIDDALLYYYEHDYTDMMCEYCDEIYGINE